MAGPLSSFRPDDLLAYVIRALLERNPGIDVRAIEDVIAGDANQAGEDNRNVARMAALFSRITRFCCRQYGHRLCASGLQAIMDAARAIRCVRAHIYCSGCGKYTRAPFVMGKSSQPF